MQKPSIVKGTRDFSPEEMAKRNYIFDTIRSVYKLFGYKQIETPSMENLSTLMGKYGEEGDKLLFKILNSGDCLAGFTDEELLQKNSVSFAAKACEKGLILLSCGVKGATIRILTPLTASDALVDEGLDVIEQVLVELA